MRSGTNSTQAFDDKGRKTQMWEGGLSKPLQKNDIAPTFYEKCYLPFETFILK